MSDPVSPVDSPALDLDAIKDGTPVHAFDCDLIGSFGERRCDCTATDDLTALVAEVERLRAEVEMKSDRATLFRDAYRDLRSGVRMSLGLPDVLASIDEQHDQLEEIEDAAIALRADRDRLAAQVERVEAALDRAEELNGVCPVQNITLGIRAALAIPAAEETEL